MRRNRDYLSVTFEGLKPKIEIDKKTGSLFRSCSGCGFEAAEVKEHSDMLFEQACRVCDLAESYVEIDCPSECGTKIHIEGDHGSDWTCPECGFDVTATALWEILDTDLIYPTDHQVQMNCALCMILGSVVHHGDMYVCTERFGMSDEIAGCGWCNEIQMGRGDFEYSYHSGCEFCDGQAGWTRDD